MTETTAETAHSPHRTQRSFLAALLLVVGALAGFLIYNTSTEPGGAAAATQRTELDTPALLAAARQDAVDFTTYNYKTIGADFQRFLDQTKDPLRSQYSTTAPDLEKEFKFDRVRSVGTIVSSGLVDRTATTGRVLVALNDAVHNKKVPKGQIVYDRIALTMVKVNGHWYVTSALEQ